MTAETYKPSFIIDADATPQQRELLTSLETGILAAPEAYSAALDAWRDAKLKGSTGAAIVKAIEFLTTTKVGVSSEAYGRAYDQWVEYMKSFADRAFSFDDLTEQAVAFNSDIMQVKSSGEEPEAKRDTMRYMRMHVFIGRVGIDGASPEGTLTGTASGSG